MILYHENISVNKHKCLIINSKYIHFKTKILISILLFLLNSCSTIILKQKYIKYDVSKGYYVYGNLKDGIPLRDSTNKLIPLISNNSNLTYSIMFVI